MSELAVANNYLEACLAWQEIINAQDTRDAKDEAGNEAMRQLHIGSFNQTRKVIVSGETALYIADGTSGLEEEIWPFMQFGELKTSGWLARIHYVRMRSEATLTWPVYEPTVLGPTEEEFITPNMDDPDADTSYHLPVDTPLRRPLHFPVALINYAISHG